MKFLEIDNELINLRYVCYLGPGDHERESELLLSGVAFTVKASVKMILPELLKSAKVYSLSEDEHVVLDKIVAIERQSHNSETSIWFEGLEEELNLTLNEEEHEKLLYALSPFTTTILEPEDEDEEEDLDEEDLFEDEEG